MLTIPPHYRYPLFLLQVSYVDIHFHFSCKSSLAEDAVLRMIRLLGAELFTVKILKNQSIVVTERMTSAEMNESDYNDDECSSSNMYNQMDMDSNQLYDKFTCETKCEEANDTAQRYRTSDDFKNGILRSETDINHNNKSNKPSSRKCKGRVLKLEFGNMFDVKDIHTADIVMLETDIPQELQADLCALLSNMKPDSRTLTYLDLRKTWCSNSFFPYRQLENNKNLSDRFPTSWSVQRGHHFYVWTKVSYLFISCFILPCMTAFIHVYMYTYMCKFVLL